MYQRIFDNLVAICKSKVTSTLKKPAYVEMCILDLNKVLTYNFHFDYIKKKHTVTTNEFHSLTLVD